MHALMVAHPLATLVTLSAGVMDADPVPLHLEPAEGQQGRLYGHVARANPLWQGLTPGAEVLALFHGPNHYISPTWYPTKQQHGKVVPTWNYLLVQARCAVQVREDREWLRRQLELLTHRLEAKMTPPWTVADAPAEFTERLLGAIVGLELTITRLTGKWKLSQNQPLQNREGIVAGLTALADPAAQEMAGWVGRHGEPPSP